MLAYIYRSVLVYQKAPEERPPGGFLILTEVTFGSGSAWSPLGWDRRSNWDLCWLFAFSAWAGFVGVGGGISSTELPLDDEGISVRITADVDLA